MEQQYSTKSVVVRHVPLYFLRKGKPGMSFISHHLIEEEEIEQNLHFSGKRCGDAERETKSLQ